MGNLIQQKIRSFCRQRQLRANSLVLTLFGDALLHRGGVIWMGSLIALLKHFQLNDRLVRTTVFRLNKEGWLQGIRAGRRADYVITLSGQKRFEEASRQIYTVVPPEWDLQWRIIFVMGPIKPKARLQLRQSLFWQGFGNLGADCFIHPSADITLAFDGLISDGHSEILHYLKPMLSKSLDSIQSAHDRDLVSRAWDLKILSKNYAEFIYTYLPILTTLRQQELEPLMSFQLRIILIHEYRRLLLRDPELPGELLPPEWPGQKARQLCANIYHLLLPASEVFLEEHHQLASNEKPQTNELLKARFS